MHVYTNGDICLDLLGKGWKPQITIRTLAISILSMLSSCKEKGTPPDNSNRKKTNKTKQKYTHIYTKGTHICIYFNIIFYIQLLNKKEKKKKIFFFFEHVYMLVVSIIPCSLSLSF